MTLVIGLLIPLLGTMLGAAFVFLMKDEMSPRLQKNIVGLCFRRDGSGISMVAAHSIDGDGNRQRAVVGIACCCRFPVRYGIPADD